jgi:hypothetical protein
MRRKALSAPGCRSRCCVRPRALPAGTHARGCSGRGRRRSPWRACRARAQVGGRLAGVFDEDPKRWRLTAEVFKTAGLAAEIATQFFPGSFVVLAGGGNFARAVGKGLGNPCFRIIQTHQAAAGNVGDIAAKEEVGLLRACARRPLARASQGAPARSSASGRPAAPRAPGHLGACRTRRSDRGRTCPAERARMALQARTGRSRLCRLHSTGRAFTDFVASRPATKANPGPYPAHRSSRRAARRSGRLPRSWRAWARACCCCARSRRPGGPRMWSPCGPRCRRRTWRCATRAWPCCALAA